MLGYLNFDELEKRGFFPLKGKEGLSSKNLNFSSRSRDRSGWDPHESDPNRFQLAEIYQNVIGTDTSEKQLELAVKLPNVRYEHTPSTMSKADLEQTVAPAGTVDLVTIAQALPWFDLPIFYRQGKLVLKKPHEVIAAGSYHVPRVTDNADKVFDELYEGKLRPYWDPGLAIWEDNYRSIDFPFEPVDGADDTGPIEFVMEKEMDLEAYLRYVTSVSPYQTAKDKGVEIPWEDYTIGFKMDLTSRLPGTQFFSELERWEAPENFPKAQSSKLKNLSALAFGWAFICMNDFLVSTF